jgi:hypothetical protein
LAESEFSSDRIGREIVALYRRMLDERHASAVAAKHREAPSA